MRHCDTPSDIISSEKPSPQTESLLPAPHNEPSKQDVATQYDPTETNADDPIVPAASGQISLKKKPVTLPPVAATSHTLNMLPNQGLGEVVTPPQNECVARASQLKGDMNVYIYDEEIEEDEGGWA